MPAAYYPVQNVSIGGLVKNVQSCSLDFNQPKTPVYTFGQLLAKGTITTQLPSATVNVVASTIEGPPFTIKFNQSEISKTVGTSVTIDTGGGKFTIGNCFLQSVGANGSVGEVPTANVSMIGSSCTFSPTSANPINIGTPGKGNLPGIENVTINGNKAGKSFSFTASIDREPVLPLGFDIAQAAKGGGQIDWIIKGLKLRAEAEIYAGIAGASAPSIGTISDINMGTNGGTYGGKGTINTAKTNLSTDGAATYTIGIDEDILDLTNVKFG
jgi:hypothetical protein